MNGAHLHLFLNHLPIVGSALAILVLAAAAAWRSERGLWLAGLLLLAVAGVGGIAADLTGEGAEEVVEDLPTVDEAAIEEHEERAEVAVISSVAGLLVAVGVFAHGRRRELGWGHLAAPLAAAAVTAGLMAWTAAAGGRIHHEELRDGSLARPMHTAQAED